MSDDVKKFLNSYGDFVTKVTSEPSLNQKSLDARMKEIDSSSPIESARLLTAALGLGSETGEFVEIVKKIFLQGKPASEDNIFHMKRELGDIMWYWATACMALKLDPIKDGYHDHGCDMIRYFFINRFPIRQQGINVVRNK